MRNLCVVDASEYSHWGVNTPEALTEREPENVALLHVVTKPSPQAAKGKTLSVEEAKPRGSMRT